MTLSRAGCCKLHSVIVTSTRVCSPDISTEHADQHLGYKLISPLKTDMAVNSADALPKESGRRLGLHGTLDTPSGYTFCSFL